MLVGLDVTHVILDSELIVTCGLDQLAPPVKPADYEELTRMIVKDSINYSAPMTFSDEDIVKVLERVREE